MPLSATQNRMVVIDAGVGNGDIQHAESKTQRCKDRCQKDTRCQDSIEQSTHCDEDGHRRRIRLPGVRQAFPEPGRSRLAPSACTRRDRSNSKVAGRIGCGGGACGECGQTRQCE
jgi:hypothetical protein